jgi:hypothetical protein
MLWNSQILFFAPRKNESAQKRATFTVELFSPQKFYFMAKEGRIVASFFIGAVVGLATGYMIARDKDTRTEDINSLKKAFAGLKDKLSKKKNETEEDIYNS